MRVFSLLIALAAAPVFAQTPMLMPQPWKTSLVAGKLAIDTNFSVAASGYSDARLQAAMTRLVSRISRQTGIPILPAKPGQKVVFAIECRQRGSEYPSLGEDESYRLDVAPDGARLGAATVTGALRGMETFAQLVVPGPDGFQAPGIHIEDQPRFGWRGLMLDVSRHWIPAAVVKRNLDAMAAVKLNVFHWHLSDDQGFRVESKLFPRLQELGSDGDFYTQAEIRDIVNYARDRGIRVIPEFDIPGHSTSWLVGYPALASAPGPYEIARTWGVQKATMDPTQDDTYTLLDGLIGEMAALFPDPFFHIGGDEVEGSQWKSSSSIQAFAKRNNLDGVHGLQTYFNQRITEILKKHKKTMIGWDEVLNPGLPLNTVVQSWRGQKSLAEAAAKGYRGILSYGYYLDHLKPASYHYGIDPLAGGARDLTPEQAARILGGEACMWAEYVSAETVDSRTWPRAAVIAERFWSPANVTDVDSMYARMEAVSRMLDWTGVDHRANYEPMLDRIAGNRGSRPLRVLADACEGVGLGPRQRAGKHTSLTPLNRLADAARPESETVRYLELAVKNRNWAEVRDRFTEWSGNDAKFQPLIKGNPLLAELSPVSQNLSQVGSIGLRALGYVEKRQPAPAAWVAQQRKLLDAMEKPNVEVSLAAVRPVRLLLDSITAAKTN